MHYFDRVKIANPYQARSNDGSRYINLYPPKISNQIESPTQNFPGFRLPPTGSDNVTAPDVFVTYILEELSSGLYELGQGLLYSDNRLLKRKTVLDSSSSTSEPVHELSFFKAGYDHKPLNETVDTLVDEDNNYMVNAVLTFTVSGYDLNKQHTGALINSMIFGD